MLKTSLKLLLFLTFFFLQDLGFADPVVIENHTVRNKWFAFDVFLGTLAGDAREYAYDINGRKLSQLNWKMNNTATIGGRFVYNFLPRFSLTAKGWTTFFNGNSTLDNYDWFNPRQSQYTNRSHHPDTDLRSAFEGDINISAWIWRNDFFEFGALGGFQRDGFNFLAKGGCYYYNSGEDTGCFPNDLPVISYKQTFDTPYVGLAGSAIFQNVEINALFKYSGWVNAAGHDEHHLRDLTYIDTASSASFYNITLDAGYYTTPSFKVFVEGLYNLYPRNRADVLIQDSVRGAGFLVEQGGGIANSSYMVAVGFSYKIGGVNQVGCCEKPKFAVGAK
jgi:plasminogen activator